MRLKVLKYLSRVKLVICGCGCGATKSTEDYYSVRFLAQRMAFHVKAFEDGFSEIEDGFF